MLIRKLEVQDAQNYLEFNEQLFAESDFLLFEAGERQTTLEEQEARIKAISQSGHSVIFVAEEQDRIVGHVAAFGNSNNRSKHSAYVVIGILQEVANQGLGTKLLQKVDQWAKERELHRLELTVMTHNLRAIGLYKKLGFKIEGTKKDSLFVNGRYVNEYYMGKLYP